MRLLVTGNQGFIGPTLTRMAQARGHVVKGLDIGYFEDCISRPEADALPDGQIVRDIRDVNAADLEGIVTRGLNTVVIERFQNRDAGYWAAA